eukprot:TRINITY_DN5732_c0_g1_i3.p2 TRINITY_DN5732_c0_g1~~TRINITY_DN5732_c0_g1_i3.p2  ORF type:complete len:101 (-),score=4.26 TRINITY_DN5732_c0_g1_i3:121-423(-)
MFIFVNFFVKANLLSMQAVSDQSLLLIQIMDLCSVCMQLVCFLFQVCGLFICSQFFWVDFMLRRQYLICLLLSSDLLMIKVWFFVDGKEECFVYNIVKIF